MNFHNIWSILFILLPIIIAVLFIGLFRKYSPPTEEVNKQKFFLVFLCSLIIPVISTTILFIALNITGLIISLDSTDNVYVVGFALVVIFLLGMLAFWVGGMLALTVGVIPAILTAFVSLLLRLYIFKKSQIPWFISTVLVGFVITMISSILLARVSMEKNIFLGVCGVSCSFASALMDKTIFLGVCSVSCSFASALVLTVFPKSRQENNK